MKIKYFMERRLVGEVVLYRTQDVKGKIINVEIPIENSLKIKVIDQKFEMGFAGTGPQQLAFAILLDACPLLGIEDLIGTASEYCREFMMDYLTAHKIRITSTYESISLYEISEWLKSK